MSATTTEQKAETKKEAPTNGEDFFGKKAVVDGNKKTADFIAKFQGEQQKALESQPEPSRTLSPLEQQRRERVEEEGEHHEDDVKLKDLPKKEKGAFVPRMLEEKKALETNLQKAQQELAAAQEELKAFKEKGVAGDPKELETLRNQLNEATTKLTEKETEYTKTVESLQSKINFRDIQEDPKFVKDYVKPIADAHSEIIDAIKNDMESMLAFDRIKAANDRIYIAKTAEDRQKAQQERDAIREELMGGLQPWQQAEVSSPLKAMFRATDNYHKALGNWVETRKRIIQETEEEGKRARGEFIGKWHTSYKAQGAKLEEETAIPEDVQKYMEKEGIAFDLSKDERVALLATQQAEGEASIDDTNRLVHQGRMFSKLQAHIKALTKLVEEKEQYIGELKGSSGDRSNRNRSEQSSGKPEGVNGFLSAWNKKHGR